MSRAAILSALRNDSQLHAYGVTSQMVIPNYAFDQSPSRTNPFIIIRWGADNIPRFDRGNHTRDFTVWAHLPSEAGTDFGIIDSITERVRAIFQGMEQVQGADGYTVTNIKWHGTGADMRDPAFDTVARNAIFTVLSRPTE